MNDNLIQKKDSSPIPKRKVLGISGSPRAKGNSDVVLTHLLRGVKQENIPSEALRLRDYYFQPCIGCEQCRKDKICTGLNDGMSLVYPKILESQGLILVSPVHNYNVTAWMKAFIDRLYCFYDFNDNRPRGWSSRLSGQERKAVIAAVCEQEDKKDMGFTIEAMRLPIQALGYEIVGELPVFGVFERGIVRKKEEILLQALHLGEELAHHLRS